MAPMCLMAFESCEAAAFARCIVAHLLTFVVRARSSSTGSGIQGATFEMSRGLCCLGGLRLRVVMLFANLGLSIESLAILVELTPCSSTMVTS